MGMTLRIWVEYEGKTSREDLGIEQKFSLEQVRDAKTDIVCEAIYRMVNQINQAREEAHAARHSGAHP
jgi:hypothetical protein